ncbi:MAG TPA: choice-of-anchor D domain-containing protein [Terriglobales bacterium]|nr:choice-of-anchor D domain-containing protein [Terriglobales bacterium]
MSRSLLSPAVILILLVSMPRAGAADVIAPKPASPNARTEHLILTPANLGFGKVAVGRRKLRTVTITNLGNSSITLFQAITKGDGFTLSGLHVPLTLARGERYTFSGVFAPRSGSDASGSISFASDVSSSAKPILTLGLRGMGTDHDQLTLDPATIDFGTVSVGSNADQRGTLIASDSEVTISSATISSPEFTLSGLSFPFTVPAGGRQGYTVTFTPQADGAVSAILSFLTYAGESLTIQGLTGIGGAQHAHSVDLLWNASTSEDVIGYNVHRGKTSGGPYRKINSVLNASTIYTDASVLNGDTYYYVTTAVDSNDQESVYSNEVQAIVP